MNSEYTAPKSRLRSWIERLDSVGVWSGKLFAWLIIPMVGALVYEVFARYAFDAPTMWAYDTTFMLYGTHFMLGAAFALAKGAHIRTDFFYRLWSVRVQAAVDLTIYLLFFFPASVCSSGYRPISR